MVEAGALAPRRPLGGLSGEIKGGCGKRGGTQRGRQEGRSPGRGERDQDRSATEKDRGEKAWRGGWGQGAVGGWRKRRPLP